MSPRLLLPLAAALALAACGGEKPASLAPPPPGGAARIAADVGFLADDLLEGRAAGMRGFDLAARYVAARFEALGLEPAGSEGWYQPVDLILGQRIPDGAAFDVLRGGEATRFAFQREFLPGVDYHRSTSEVRGPMVFVGQAVVAPEFGVDDFAGVDLQGRIAVYLNGAPERFPNDQRAFYSSGREKLANLVARGAIGAIAVSDPEREERNPWERSARNWVMPGMRLRGPDGEPIDTHPELRVTMTLSAAAAKRLFEGAPQSAEEVFAQQKAGTLTAFALPGEALLASRSHTEPVQSRNVIARLPGRDAQLADEHVLLTAHLDHVGFGAPVRGDRLYNGALDNALGTALMLEAAQQAVLQPQAPRRSLLFAALTAEERGLLGAEYLAEHPVTAGPVVANINMDMPVILFPQADVVPIGIEHSSLRAVVESSVAELGMQLSPDPFPEEVVFIRSDQFAFVRRGIPAVYLNGGQHSLDPAIDGKAVAQDFLREHYHQPSDDVSRPIHYESAARLALLNQRIAFRIANGAQRPRWNAGNFFGERFAPAAK
jgi:hypothetical protein